MIHHELPGKVVPCHVHPVFRAGSSVFETGRRRKVFRALFKQMKRSLDLATAMAPFPCTSLASWMMMWLRAEQNPHHCV